MGRRESGPEFHINFGRIGLGHFTCKSAWIGSRQLDLRPVLATTIRYSIWDAQKPSNFLISFWPLMSSLRCGPKLCPNRFFDGTPLRVAYCRCTVHKGGIGDLDLYSHLRPHSTSNERRRIEEWTDALFKQCWADRTVVRQLFQSTNHWSKAFAIRDGRNKNAYCLRHYGHWKYGDAGIPHYFTMLWQNKHMQRTNGFSFIWWIYNFTFFICSLNYTTDFRNHSNLATTMLLQEDRHKLGSF